LFKNDYFLNISILPSQANVVRIIAGSNKFARVVNERKICYVYEKFGLENDNKLEYRRSRDGA